MAINSHGYVVVRYEGRMVKEHRLVWFKAFGYWPKELDHINGDKTDNRLENLREVTRSENMLNIHHSQGASGHRGVHFNKARGKYSAKIRINYKLHHLGFFLTAEMAAEAYRKAKANVSVFS